MGWFYLINSSLFRSELYFCNATWSFLQSKMTGVLIKIVSSIFYLISGLLWKRIIPRGLNYHLIFYRTIFSILFSLVVISAFSFIDFFGLIALSSPQAAVPSDTHLRKGSWLRLLLCVIRMISTRKRVWARGDGQYASQWMKPNG